MSNLILQSTKRDFYTIFADRGVRYSTKTAETTSPEMEAMYMRQPELRENENTTVIMSKADEIKRRILIVVSAVVVISAICASIYLISKRFGKRCAQVLEVA